MVIGYNYYNITPKIIIIKRTMLIKTLFYEIMPEKNVGIKL